MADLKSLVLGGVSSPITRRVYNSGLHEFIARFEQEPRPRGFTKASVTAWRVALEARGLGPISININVRITAVRKLAGESADSGLLAPELASGIARIKGVRSHGVSVGNWLSLQQAQRLLNSPDVWRTSQPVMHKVDRPLLDAVICGRPACTSRIHADRDLFVFNRECCLEIIQ